MDILTGPLFKQMLESAGNNLANQHSRIDALNVFPVPDGDTGTNMSLTFTQGVSDALKVESESISDIAKAFSKGLLMGARGNSGVITSQIFRGVYQSVKGLNTINALQLANAFVNGSRVAYKAVMKPVEGTILTVIREASDYTLLYAADHAEELKCVDVLDKLVEEAKVSLENTPNLLPVLKEVGVVDSGGSGLVAILEGFASALHGTIIAKEDVEVVDGNAQTEFKNEEFGYCTEFIIRLDPKVERTFKEKKLKEKLSSLGNSLVLVRDDDLVKVHVHTLRPGDALNVGQRYGEFVKLKIENMQEQHEHIITMAKESEVEPSKPEQPRVPYALIAVAAGEGLGNLFKELRVNSIVSGGQTMNPSTDDFVKAMDEINADHIFILPNNANIVMAAQQAAQVIKDKEAYVIPTTTIPQGLCACMMFNPEVDVESNKLEMNDALTHVKTGQVTYAIKDSVYDGKPIKEGDYMGICEKNIITTLADKMDTTKALLDALIDEDSEIVTLIGGEDIEETELHEIQEYIETKFDIEVEAVLGGQPVYSFIIGVE